MKKSELEVVANFLKKMKEKHPVDADSEIIVELNGNLLVVSKSTYCSPEEGYDIRELEKFKLED